MSEKKDFNLLNEYVAKAKKDKPKMIAVSDEDWSNALDGYHESILQSAHDDMTVDEAWTLIYFCAMAFCRGIEFAEVQVGMRNESLYPRY